MSNSARQNIITKASRKSKAVNDADTAQAKDRIRQIIGEQGHRVIFPGWPERVEVRMMDGQGNMTRTRSLGKLEDIATVSEEELVALLKQRLSDPPRRWGNNVKAEEGKV